MRIITNLLSEFLLLASISMCNIAYLAFFYSEWIARFATKFINGYRYDKTKQQTAMFAMPCTKQYDINDNSSDKAKISCNSETNYNTLPPED